MTHTLETREAPASMTGWDGLGEAVSYVVIPTGFLFYGLYAMAAGWSPIHAFVGLAGYGMGWVMALMRINR